MREGKRDAWLSFNMKVYALPIVFGQPAPHKPCVVHTHQHSRTTPTRRHNAHVHTNICEQRRPGDTTHTCTPTFASSTEQAKQSTRAHQ